RGKTGTDLDPLDRVDAHQGIGQLRVQTVEYRLAKARWHPLGDDGNLRTHRILIPAQLVHVGFQLGHLVRIGTEEGIVTHRVPAPERDVDRPQLAHVTAHGDALARQILARD